MKLKFKKHDPNATAPHPAGVGYDLYPLMLASKVIKAGEVEWISTGISLDIPNGYFGSVYAEPWLSAYMGVRPSDCVGLLASGNTEELIVPLRNDSGKDREIEPGSPIARVVILPVVDTELEEYGVIKRSYEFRDYDKQGSNMYVIVEYDPISSEYEAAGVEYSNSYGMYSPHCSYGKLEREVLDDDTAFCNFIVENFRGYQEEWYGWLGDIMESEDYADDDLMREVVEYAERCGCD